MDKEDIESVHSEIRILKKNPHPNICRIHDWYESVNKIYIRMELCKGGALGDKVLKDGAIDEGEIAMGMGKIVRALVFCHKQRIMHRDIKPDNIMFGGDEGDQIKLIDFGFAVQQKKNPGNEEQDITGTPRFIAPELFTNKYNH